MLFHLEAVVADQAGARALTARASALIRSTYTWDAIAQTTVGVYVDTLAD